MLTNDQLWRLMIERFDKIDRDNAALSQLIGRIGVGTNTIATDPSTGAPLLPETGGAINVGPVTPKRTSRDEYWDRQPEEVRVLKDMPVGDARTALAMELAAKYPLERRIAVWNWNPLSSMQSWKDAGYTWVPALGQPDIPVSPGLTFFGKPSYDPANPPPGSIKVDTSFAEGYEY